MNMVLTMHSAFPGSQGLKSFSLKADKLHFNLRYKKYVYAINKEYSYALFVDKLKFLFLKWKTKKVLVRNRSFFFRKLLVRFFIKVSLFLSELQSTSEGRGGGGEREKSAKAGKREGRPSPQSPSLFPFLPIPFCCLLCKLLFRACLKGGGGPQVDELTLSAGVKFCHVPVSRWDNPGSRDRIRVCTITNK